ncbi:MAG: InlB B-repeat-containing protein [Lachnospiraceae bacterium]|nr:InlB B-repeat-containing protein [Lachnospiraceae bacterium]
MKSSVTSRKQRFWALLLAVVMVVGLLPVAGVKAAEAPENGYIIDQLNEGDILIGGTKIYRGTDGASPMSLVYLSPDSNEGLPVNEGDNTRAILPEGNYYIVLSKECEDENVYKLRLQNLAESDYNAVEFVTNGHGTEPNPNPRKVNKNTALTETDDLKLTEEGYVFGGWYIDPNFETQWDFSNDVTRYVNQITGVLVLYAKWTPTNEYLVKFIGNNGDYGWGEMEDQTIIVGGDTVNKLNPNTYVKPGYKFNDWVVVYSSGSDGTIIHYVDEAQINDDIPQGDKGKNPGDEGNTSGKYERTLDATWAVDLTGTYTVNFDDNYPEIEDYIAETPHVNQTPSKSGTIWVEVENPQAESDYDIRVQVGEAGEQTAPTYKYYKYAGIEWPSAPFNTDGDPRHYVFGGWTFKSAAQNDSEIEIEKPVYDDENEAPYPINALMADSAIYRSGNIINMEAIWNPSYYNFRFNSNHAGVADPDGLNNLPYNGKADIPNLETQENNLEFIGWVFDTNNISEDTIIKSGSGYSVKDIVIKLEKAEADYINAYIEENEIDLGGDEGRVVIPPAPWNNNGIDILTGVWKQKYTVTYDKNAEDATGTMATQTFLEGETVKIADCDFAREGYAFSHWATEGNTTVPIEYNPEDIFPGENEKPKDLVLYAQWEEIPTHTVTYCDGDDAGVCNTKKITYDEGDIILSENKGTDDAKDTSFNKPGSTVVGWIERTDAGDIKYELGGIYSNFNRDIYLFADWSPNEDVTLVFDGNGGKGETKSITGPEGNNVYLPADYERIGYKLVGWDRDHEAKKAEFTFENEVALFAGKVYAIWEPENYIIQLDYNPSYWPSPYENPETYEPKPYSDESKVTIPIEVDDPYYNFIGWSLEPENTVADIYTENTTVKKIVDEADGLCIEPSISENEEEKIFTLYGVWKRKIAYIKFLPGAEDVTGNMDTQNFDVNEYQKLTKNAFERKGYSFLGWKCEGVENLFADERTIRMTEEETVELTAVWEKLPVAIWNDGNGNELYSAPIDDPENLPPYGGPTPTKTGYDFAGWDGPKDGDNGNKVFTPKFTPKSNGGGGYVAPNPPAPTYYTITWIDGDNNLIYTEQVAEGLTPVYNKAQYGTPTKNPTGYATYSFNNSWSPAITKVTGNQEYIAQFDMFGPEGGQENPTPTVTPTVTPTPTTTPAPAAPSEYDIEYYEELPDGTEVQLKKTNNPDKYTYGVGAEIKYGIDKEGYTFEGWYSKRSKKYVKKVGTKTKGTVKLYAIFVPDDSGNGNEGDNGKGLPTDFSTLFVRLIDYTENSMTLKWEKMEYVDGYDILGSRCNSKDVIRPYEPIVSVDADTDEYVMSDLLAKTYYKFYVRAFILVNGEKRYITTSINVHGVTLNDTYGVADELEIEKVVAKYINGKSKTKYVRSTAADDGEINITLKVGQSLKIVTSEYNKDGKEIRAHRPISFESSDPAICKIGKKSSHKYGVAVAGKANTYKSHTITALAAGECDIYAFAQNGVFKKIHVTVK